MSHTGTVGTRCQVMGILNVTPDSFSDGGRWYDTEAAVHRGLALIADGADIVDVGGESTRPGAARTPADVELARVLPVVRELAALGTRVSVDTTRAQVAAAAIEAGATIVNDVSGGLADPDMHPVVAANGVTYVAMHWRGHATGMDGAASYEDVVGDVLTEVDQRCHAAVSSGIAPDRILVDPGLGFAKKHDHNWTLLAAIPAIRALGFPVLIGASRKRFIGILDAGIDLSAPEQRDDATTAITALVAAEGVWGVRVHEARASAHAVRVVARLHARSPQRTS